MSARVKPMEMPATDTVQDEAAQLAAPQRSARSAVLALLLATLCWGCGFTWAKAGGEDVNRFSGAGQNSPVGPILLLGVRFTIAGVLWLTIFPKARRGWSRKSFTGAAILGSLLSFGIFLQHLGLDRTSEAVSAFLTSLTIVFVPLISTIVLRRSPAIRTWFAVMIAATGVWLMTGGASGARLGVGEILGLLCSIIFSVHTLAVNAIVPRDDPFRMTGGQFLFLGIAALALTPMLPGGVSAMSPRSMMHTFGQTDVLLNLLKLIAVPTIVAFGLHTQFQPRLDATRATLIYLMEPIFASAYAYVFVGRKLAAIQLLGAALILAANGLVELLEALRSPRRRGPEYAPREVV